MAKRVATSIYEFLEITKSLDGNPIKTNEGKTILLFRGQQEKPYEKVRQGYSAEKSYGMLFTSIDINSAYFYSLSFYTNPWDPYNRFREIIVFEVPNKIAKIEGHYIDRATSIMKSLKEEGYIGMMSNVGELTNDKGEVGLFDVYEPIERFSTDTGYFSKEDLDIMAKKYGLSEKSKNLEKYSFEKPGKID